MALDEISQKIGDAWETHRKGDNAAAVSMFESVIGQDAGNVDGHYGLGLALRATGNKLAAVSAFQKAKTLAEQHLAEIRAGRSVNDLSTTKDDRNMMLIRMLEQRIAES